MADRLINEFVVFFLVLDPLGMAPVFWALTHKGTRAFQKRMALLGVGFATSILLVFSFIGHGFLSAFGIGVPAFRIAGGILLFMLSIDMIYARQTGLRSTTRAEREEAERHTDISVFPLAFPLIAGPGAMTTVLLFSDRPEGTLLFASTIGMMLLVLVLVLLALLSADTIMRHLGETGANAVSRILGLVLAALSAQYVVDGIRESFW